MRDDDLIAYLGGEDASEGGASEGGALDAGERAALDGVRALLGDAAVWAEPDPDTEDRVRAAVAAAAASSTATPRPDSDVKAVPKRRARFVIVAGALVAAAAITAAVIIGRSSSEPAAGTRFAAALTGTALSPHVTGTAGFAKTPSGWHIDLHAEGLARRDGNEFYEAWMKRADGTLVPVGTFNDARSVTLWSGVSPAVFRGFTVTAEEADGNQASSGRRVLVGTMHETH